MLCRLWFFSKTFCFHSIQNINMITQRLIHILITTAGQVLYTPGLSEKITPTEGSGYEYASILP